MGLLWLHHRISGNCLLPFTVLYMPGQWYRAVETPYKASDAEAVVFDFGLWWCLGHLTLCWGTRTPNWCTSNLLYTAWNCVLKKQLSDCPLSMLSHKCVLYGERKTNNKSYSYPYKQTSWVPDTRPCEMNGSAFAIRPVKALCVSLP